MFGSLKLMIRDEDGVTMPEYGLMLALIAMVCIGAVKLIGTNLNTLFTNVENSI